MLSHDAFLYENIYVMIQQALCNVRDLQEKLL